MYSDVAKLRGFRQLSGQSLNPDAEQNVVFVWLTYGDSSPQAPAL